MKILKRKICLLVLSIFIFSCVGNEFPMQEKSLELSNGKNTSIFIQTKDISENEKILVIEYQVDEEVIKEETIENDVLKIWKQVETIANEIEIDEAIIKSKYFIGIGEKTKKKIYKDFLFEAEKIENGTWKIRKVN